MKKFAIDESGYTGCDFLNETQMWQGACAIDISYDDARHLIRQHFPRLQAPELKFSSLKKGRRNEERLFNIQKDLLDNFPCITCVADKRYMLTMMFIEYAVEPFYYDNGMNLYEDGGNVAMASLFYSVGPTFFGSGFDHILQSFQNAMHQKTQEAVNALIESVLIVDWQRLREVLAPLAFRHQDCIEAIMRPSTSTDAAFPILCSLISCTELMFGEPYIIEHDRSDNLL